MPHFFIESKNVSEDKILIVDEDNYRHIAKSLRSKVGEKLLLIDENEIQYETVIDKIDSRIIECRVLKKYPSQRDLDFDLYLAQSPLRSDSQLTIIEKSTELGVRGVYPVLTDNCAVNKSVIEKKQEKWQRIMVEASKQCERSRIPACYPLTTLENLLKEDFNKIMVLYERETEESLKDYLSENPVTKGEKVLVIIGPEGGFSEREYNLFKTHNLPLLTLGDLILKAETAVIVTLGNIVYEYKG